MSFNVCVFCGSRPGSDDRYHDAADAFGRELAARGMTLIYGGGRVGLMGVIADAALELEAPRLEGGWDRAEGHVITAMALPPGPNAG